MDSDLVYTLLCCMANGDRRDWRPNKGVFELLELRISMPFCPGDCIFFHASLLAHRVTPIKEHCRQCVLTMFTCRYIETNLVKAQRQHKASVEDGVANLVDNMLAWTLDLVIPKGGWRALHLRKIQEEERQAAREERKREQERRKREQEQLRKTKLAVKAAVRARVAAKKTRIPL